MDKIKILNELKARLSITWDDDTIDTNLNNIIEDAIITMNHKLGAEVDYSVPGMEHSLFLKYCMYDYNNCSSEFDKTYLSEIYQCRARQEVKKYREEQDNEL